MIIFEILSTKMITHYSIRNSQFGIKFVYNGKLFHMSRWRFEIFGNKIVTVTGKRTV